MKRLILFAHFDPENRIRPYICHHLRALHALGGEIHFVSNSSLSPAELDKVRPWVQRTRLRENEGFDFSMWKDALQTCPLEDWDELLLTNSSIVGPLGPLQPLFDRMAGHPCDFWGLTENLWPTPHLQSFFLVFRKSALEAPAFRAFWDSVLPYRNKFGTIFAYEVGLTLYLKDQGLIGEIAFPIEQLPQSWFSDLRFGRKIRTVLRKGRNASLYYPDLLIRSGMPYVKLELLSRNPEKLRLSMVRKCVRAQGYDLDLLD